MTPNHECSIVLTGNHHNRLYGLSALDLCNICHKVKWSSSVMNSNLPGTLQSSCFEILDRQQKQKVY